MYIADKCKPQWEQTLSFLSQLAEVGMLSRYLSRRFYGRMVVSRVHKCISYSKKILQTFSYFILYKLKSYMGRFGEYTSNEHNISVALDSHGLLK